jgi:hypothetical protein
MDTQINGLLQRNTMTNTWWLLRVCIVVAAGVGLASCTKEQTTQVLTQPAQTIQPLSPCFPAGVATTGTPEFCVNVTEIQPSNHETHVDIDLSLMNRTGHRLYITVIGPTTLTDSSGRTWNTGESMGFGGLNTPVPIEPDGRTQGAISFHRQEQILPGTTFSLHGEIGIMKMDSRGQVVPGEIAIKRGIHLSDIRIQQQPPQSIGTKKQHKNTKSAQASPRRATPKRPKPSTSSKSSAPGPVVDASGSGKPKSQRLASVKASRSPDRTLNTIDSPAAGVVTSKTASKFIGNGGSGPEVIGLRIGMTPDQARAKFKSHGFGSSTKSPNRPFDSYTESSNTLTYSLPGQAPQPVPNTGYVAQISGVISDIKVPVTENSGDVLTIFFGPVPGQGGIVLLNRTEYIPASKRPTIAAFTKILIETYGTPTELMPDFPGIYRCATTTVELCVSHLPQRTSPAVPD